MTNDTSIASGEVVSIRYTCDVATHQQLDVAIPSSIFNAKFKGAKNIGIVLTSELVTNFPDGAVFGSVKSYQKKTIDRSFENAGKTSLSFESTGIQALEIADAFAKSNRPVVLGLFESGRKAPITQKDILLDFKIPVEGSTKAFGEAFSRCKFAY